MIGRVEVSRFEADLTHASRRTIIALHDSEQRRQTISWDEDVHTLEWVGRDLEHVFLDIGRREHADVSWIFPRG
jgi:hypothetical protein